MAKWHINDEGNPGTCSAKDGNCPFGYTAEQHFDSKIAAVHAYEAGAFEAHNRSLQSVGEMEDLIINKNKYTDEFLQEWSEYLENQEIDWKEEEKKPFVPENETPPF